MGSTRVLTNIQGLLYKEIKDITGAYTARCGVMHLSSGKTATEEREVKIR